MRFVLAAALLTLTSSTTLFAQAPVAPPAADADSDAELLSPVAEDVSPRLAAGEAAFWRSCTGCHDAERATSRSKSFAAWQATIRRMSEMAGADVPRELHDAIAAFLVSQSGQTPADEPPSPEAAPLSLHATLSPIWRGGNDGTTIENPGFFPDVWLGGHWRSNGNVSAKVTACTSCHETNNTGMGFELVEAAVRWDLWHESNHDGVGARSRLALIAGRFVVPFGAISEQVHPGIRRTLTDPLAFNMGRRVGRVAPLQPVLPAPYADEGLQLHYERELFCAATATLDAYVVNGLQTGAGRVFLDSRSYTDNNSDPAVGGRLTIGSRRWRLGGSLTGGTLQPAGSPTQNYRVAGADVVLRPLDDLQALFEYAIRTEDSFAGRKSMVYGTVTELHWQFADPWSLLARYDTLEHRGTLGTASTDRITWGVSRSLPGGGLLIFNHERWRLPGTPARVDLIGIRLTLTF